MKFLKLLYRGWMKMAHAIGRVNTLILLTVMYAILFGLLKMFSLFFRKDLFDSEQLPESRTYWIKRENFRIEKEAFLKPY